MKYLNYYYGILAMLLSVVAAHAQTPNPTTLIPEQCLLNDGKVIVPNLLGFVPNKAKKIAESCGLVWSYSNSPGTLSYESRGTIGDQEPSGGTILKTGDVLRGFVSNGIWMPNLIGMNESAATFLITNQRFGLVKKYIRVPGSLGTVIDQDPVSGVLVDSGPAVTITILEGFKLLSMVGRSYKQTVNELIAQNLKPMHTGGDISSGWRPTVPPCEGEKWFPVIRTADPGDGALVSEGTVINLTTQRRTISTFSQAVGEDCK